MMADGEGCTCYAGHQGECACDADWTPSEVIQLRQQVAELTAKLDKKYLYVWQELNYGKAYITANSNHSCAPAGHGYVGKIEVQDD